MRIPPVPALIGLGALAAVLVLAVVAARGPEPIAAEPSPTPAPTETETEPEPEPEPEPDPEPEPVEAEPFQVRLTGEGTPEIVTTDNAPVLSVASLEIDEEVAGRAAEIARAALEEFLDAQFTDRATWFGPGPIEALLTPRAAGALTDEDRAALGQLELDVDHVVTGHAEAEAMVTMHGEHPRNVALDFRAALTVVAGDGGETPLALEGTLLFLPTEDGWLVEAVDATLTGEGEG